MDICKIFISSLFLFSYFSSNSQNIFSFKIENTIYSYSKKDNSNLNRYLYGDNQILVEGSVKLSWNFNGLIMGVGANYHDRNLKEIETYWISVNSPLPITTVVPVPYGPYFYSAVTPNASIKGKLKYLEIPIFLGYHLNLSNNLSILSEVQWYSVSRINKHYFLNISSPNEIDEIKKNDLFTKTIQNHGYTLDFIRKLNPNWELVFGVAFRSDNFSFERIRYGLKFGINYQIISKKVSTLQSTTVNAR